MLSGTTGAFYKRAIEPANENDDIGRPTKKFRNVYCENLTTVTVNGGVPASDTSHRVTAAESDILINKGDVSTNSRRITTLERDYNIAPRGVADDWVVLETTQHGQTVYAEDIDTLIFSGNSVTMHYSLDGGLTQNSCTFSVPPTGFMTVGYNAGLFVALNYNDFGAYTSPDGINWTAQTQNAFGFVGFNIVYYNGLYIAGTNVDNFRVATSPDGVNWTLRVASAIPLRFAVGPDRVVSSGNMYSLDGITWTDSTTIFTARSMVYNPDTETYIALDQSNTDVLSSADGDTWTRYTNGFGLNGPNIMLYSSHFRQYYAPTTDSLGKWTIASTPDPITVPFRNRLIPTATTQGGGSYSIEYLPIHDRFLMASNDGHLNYSVLTKTF